MTMHTHPLKHRKTSRARGLLLASALLVATGCQAPARESGATRTSAAAVTTSAAPRPRPIAQRPRTAAIPAHQLWARDAEDHARWSARATWPARPLPAAWRAREAAGLPGHANEALGLPSMVWLSQPAPTRQDDALPAPEVAGVPGAPAWPRRRIIQAARDALGDHAALYGASPRHIDQLTVTQVHDTGRGPILITLAQRVGELELIDERVVVALSRELLPIAITGWLNPHLPARDEVAFTRSMREIVAAAYEDMTGARLVADRLDELGADEAGWSRFEMSVAAGQAPSALRRARVRAGLRSVPGGAVGAYQIELDMRASGALRSMSYVFRADDGAMLARIPLTRHEQHTYQVWADPQTGWPLDGPFGNAYSPHPSNDPDDRSAPLVPQQRVTVQGANRYQDPWLPDGAERTQGNHAFAYADLSGEDGFDERDVTATTTAPGAFLHPNDPSKDPQESTTQIMGAVTHMFYVVNHLHDLFYDRGFDEAAGNAQSNNYGRGGVAGDPILAEGQDQSGYNNANMTTYADGLSPRMQMYLYDEAQDEQVTIPGKPPLSATVARYGARLFELSAPAVLVDDGEGITADSCEQTAQDLTGKIAVIDWAGECSSGGRVWHAQQAGAVGVVVINDDTDEPNDRLRLSSSEGFEITIPALVISYNSGRELLATMQQGEPTITMSATVVRDGTVSSQTIAHEWMHYMFKRLAPGVENNQGDAMNEGNSDFASLLLSVRPEAAALPGNDRYQGAYGYGTYQRRSHYFGARRAPYSTSFELNPLTFKHIESGVPLPEGPQLDDRAGDNASIHRSGEVWGNAAFACYVNLINRWQPQGEPRSFEASREVMLTALVAALKLLPMDPTYTEFRDALLVAMLAQDERAYALCWEGFAARGMGLDARSPGRYDDTHSGVVESLETGPRVLALEARASEDPAQSCDVDGVLDAGERGAITLTLLNRGSAAAESVKLTVRPVDPAQADALVWPEGASRTLPALRPLVASTVTLPLELAPSWRGESLALEVEIEGVEDDPITLALPVVQVGVDEAERASALDTFNTTESVWSADALRPDTRYGQAWRRVFTAPNRAHWAVGNAASYSDLTLTSPPIRLADQGPLALEFVHRHAFEDFNEEIFYDGGVIEISADNGQTWEDLSAYGEVPYDGEIDARGDRLDSYLPLHNNPLAGRPGFGGESAGYPDWRRVRIALDDRLAGETIRLRFRAASDARYGDEGWEIDDVRIDGAATTPFTAPRSEDQVCDEAPPQTTASAASDTLWSGDPGTLLATATPSPRLEGPVTMTWAQDGGPNVALSSTSAAGEATFTAPVVEAETTLRFVLTATQQTTASAPRRVDVTVRPIPAPTLRVEGPGGALDAGQQLTLKAIATTPRDTPALTYLWSQLDGPPIALPAEVSGDTLALTIPASAAGQTLTLKVTARDASSPASEATIALTVRPKVEDEGCATTGHHAPTRLPATLLLLLGAAARWRRQRRA